MGGRGASGGAKIDAGFGVKISQSTLDLRMKVNQAIGTNSGRDLAVWSIRKDILSGKTESQVVKEDRGRLQRAQERQKEKKSETQRTFVNSYGEATTREITSTTYGNAMRRQEQAVLRNMGVTTQRESNSSTTYRRRRRRNKR